MKIQLNKFMAAYLIALALWMPSAAQAPATEIPNANNAKHYQEVFKDLPMSPVKSDHEDCFNDSMSDDPIPQG